MKSHARHRLFSRAASLIEAVIAVGVLAIAIPLALATISSAGKSGLSSEAENHCAWIVSACLGEIQASRVGQSAYFPATSKGVSIPPSGEYWTLAFGSDGKLVGEISQTLLERGVKELDGKPIFYLASLTAKPVTVNDGETQLMNVLIAITYPASVPVGRREQLAFYTRIP